MYHIEPTDEELINSARLAIEWMEEHATEEAFAACISRCGELEAVLQSFETILPKAKICVESALTARVEKRLQLKSLLEKFLSFSKD